MLRLAILTLSLALGVVRPPSAAAADFPPFKIAGNLYYVGGGDAAVYLVATPQGLILINSDLESDVPRIRDGIEKLGFRFIDIKVLLISQAHFDHDAGSAAIKRLTGAKYMVMDADVPVVESGGKADFQYGSIPSNLYPPANVDRVLHDGDTVTLGGATLVAHLTAGHTKGCTTWTMTVEDAGKRYNVVIVGGPNVNAGYKLVGNTAYPRIADDFARGFHVLNSLPCDIFLGAHGSYFDLESKYPRLKTAGVAAFVDPDGYKAFVADREAAFRAELAKQTKPRVTPGRAPSEFKELPLAVRDELTRRECIIPQPARQSVRNVTRGNFLGTGEGWAVLCSRNSASSILVFQDGRSRAVSEIGERPDADFVQDVGAGRLAFSRGIRAVSPAVIRQFQRSNEEARGPSPTHDGIDDMFLGKASTVWYWHRSRWIQISGAN